MSRILVIDLGGGTFDVTLWDVGKQADPEGYGFRELGRNSDSLLGGLDWDREIAKWVLEAVKLAPDDHKRVASDIRSFGHTNLFEQCEQAKLNFSREMEIGNLSDPRKPLDPLALSRLHVTFRPSRDAGKKILTAEMPSELFLKMNERLLDQCEEKCLELFDDVKRNLGLPEMGWGNVNEIHMAGGGSRLPTVIRRFAQISGKTPNLVENPQQAVAKGAAIIAEKWRLGTLSPRLIGKPALSTPPSASWSRDAARTPAARSSSRC